jgi:erythronate-4-phosphate dehydrogenase
VGTKSLQIVSDANIPFLREYFSDIATISTIPGEIICSETVKNADALLVRSITTVNERLLKDSRISFVGSATTGVDHVDLEYLAAESIGFANAAGENAESVVEYVLSALFSLAVERSESLEGKTVGIIGCGAIGSRLRDRLRALGLTVVVNDPPLADSPGDRDNVGEFLELRDLLSVSDIVTLHVPLTREGKYLTFHLIGTGELAEMRSGVWILNTSRGGIVDEEALRESFRQDRIGGLVLDVWEDEPIPDPWLHERADLATPHIAGYSVDARRNATRVIASAFCDHFSIESGCAPDSVTSGGSFVLQASSASEITDRVSDLVFQMCDVRQDDSTMRELLTQTPGDRADLFRRLRRSYPDRFSYGRYVLELSECSPRLRALLSRGLGITVRQS